MLKQMACHRGSRRISSNRKHPTPLPSGKTKRNMQKDKQRRVDTPRKWYTPRIWLFTLHPRNRNIQIHRKTSSFDHVQRSASKRYLIHYKTAPPVFSQNGWVQQCSFRRCDNNISTEHWGIFFAFEWAKFICSDRFARRERTMIYHCIHMRTESLRLSLPMRCRRQWCYH